MKSKLTLALIAAGMMGFGLVSVQAEEGAAPAAPAADAKKAAKEAKMMEILKKKYPTEMAEIEKLKATDPAAADQKLADLKAKAKAAAGKKKPKK